MTVTMTVEVEGGAVAVEIVVVGTAVGIVEEAENNQAFPLVKCIQNKRFGVVVVVTFSQR